MNRDSNRLTNFLLFVVLGLLLLGFAIPGQPENPAPPAPPPAAPEPDLADLVAKVDLLIQRSTVPPPAPASAADGDEIVVRIPGKLARDLGITGDQLRTLVALMTTMQEKVGATRSKANEVAAIATLRNCSSAQAQFQATVKADVDNDGTGEFGSFRELSGAQDIRGDPRRSRLNPPVLSGAFRNPLVDKGYVSRSGYCFLIYLPDRAGEGVAVDAEGYGRVDPEWAERVWCMYAWPMDRDAGTRTFMMNQSGDVLTTEAPEYVGEHAPLPGAAFRSDGIRCIAGQTAAGARGQDGHDWKQAN